MNIRIGILGNAGPGIRTLLAQEGVDWITLTGTEDSSSFSAMLIGNGSRSASLDEYARKYLRSGGGVLCDLGTAHDIFGIGRRSASLRYLVPEPGSLFATAGLIDVYADGSVSDNATELKSRNGRPTLFSGEFGGGYLISIPFSLDATILDSRVSTKSFYARRPRLPFERVSLAGRGAVRKLFSRALELLHHRRNIPYVHKWYYPDGAPSYFVFRIDTDYAELPALESLAGLLDEHRIPGSWYIDVKSQEKILSFFAGLNGHEKGIHCYEHRTFDDVQRNVDNIGKARAATERAGIETRGFVAPYGRWNAGLARALEQCKFEYSSEFAYDYDNLPSYPHVEGRDVGVLQVPVHPVSLGSLRRQGFSLDEMHEYFSMVLAAKRGSREPWFIYHHPNDHNHPVLEQVFAMVADEQIPVGTMGAFARWWRERNSVSCPSVLNSDRVTIGGDAPNAVLCRVSTAKGELMARPGATITPGSADLAPPAPVPQPGDIARIRKFNPWVPLIRVENFLFR